jgi:hypothetical protein
MHARLCFLSLLLIFSLSANAGTAKIGKVVYVTPRNGIVVDFIDGTRQQVVLAYLSIPFGQMPYADRAHQVLQSQLLGRQVNVRPVGRQGTDYISGLVYVGSQNFNEDFLRRGHAWVNHLQRPPPQWHRIEAAANQSNVGLWTTDSPTHPIDWEMHRRHAELVSKGLTIVSEDPDSPELFANAFVGDRAAKRYYDFTCAQWTQIPNRQLRLFTTVQSAEADGFVKAPCT